MFRQAHHPTVMFMWWCKQRGPAHSDKLYEQIQISCFPVNNEVNIIPPLQWGVLNKKHVRLLLGFELSQEREEMFHRDDNKLHGSFLAICREEGGDLLAYKAESISMNKCCISAGPVTWSASPLLMNSPYFTPTQMNVARKRRKLADSNIPTLYLLTAFVCEQVDKPPPKWAVRMFFHYDVNEFVLT